VVHNSSGIEDAILARPFIGAIKQHFENIKITLECPIEWSDLWKDFGLPIVPYKGASIGGLEPTRNSLEDYLFFNAGLSVFPDLLSTWGLTLACQIQSFNRQMSLLGLKKEEYVIAEKIRPWISFPRNLGFLQTVKKKGVLVENISLRRNWNYFYLNNCIARLARRFPDITFYCWGKPNEFLPNIVDVSHLKLIDVASFSEKCFAYILRGGELSAAIFSETNCAKPKCLVGWNLPYSNWMMEEQKQVTIGKNFYDICLFLKEHSMESSYLVLPKATESIADFTEDKKMDILPCGDSPEMGGIADCQVRTNRKKGQYYGQFNPPMDKIIEEYFPNQEVGNCIEVGAVDGVFISNTLYFERLGWNVLCLEPIPDYYEQLRKNRKLALNYAVSDINSDDSVFTIVTMNNQNQSSISGLAIDGRLIDDHIALGLNPKKKEIKVRSRRLDWCIDNYFNVDSIDFISIDTEGNELEVLKSFDVNKYNIKLLMVENNYNEPSIEKYLNGLGWKKDQRVEVNDFYVKNDEGIPEKNNFIRQYFAEFETDRIIRENYFPDSNYKGTLIEVGGATPDYLSMSKHFKLNGWRTIVFEPNPKFVELHQKANNEIYNYACSNENADDVSFQIVNWLGNKNYESEGITDHSFSAISVKESYLKKHGYSSVKDLAVTEIQVKVRRLDTILSEIQVENIDFLSIDVEGWEIEVLQGLNLSKHRPKVILLENYIHEESYTKFMEKFNYRLDEIIEHNYVYVSNDYVCTSVVRSPQQ